MSFDSDVYPFITVVAGFFRSGGSKLNLPGLVPFEACDLIMTCMTWSFEQPNPPLALGIIDYEQSTRADEAKKDLIKFLEEQGVYPNHLSDVDLKTTFQRAVLYAYGLTTVLADKGPNLLPTKECSLNTKLQFESVTERPPKFKTKRIRAAAKTI